MASSPIAITVAYTASFNDIATVATAASVVVRLEAAIILFNLETKWDHIQMNVQKLDHFIEILCRLVSITTSHTPVRWFGLKTEFFKKSFFIFFFFLLLAAGFCVCRTLWAACFLSFNVHINSFAFNQSLKNTNNRTRKVKLDDECDDYRKYVFLLCCAQFFFSFKCVIFRICVCLCNVNERHQHAKESYEQPIFLHTYIFLWT